MPLLRRRLLLAFLLLAGPAEASPWQASYIFTAAGVTVMEAQVRLEVGGAGMPYAIETRTRARGLAVLFLRGEQVARSEGVWRGGRPFPRLHRSSGNWRGSPRRTLLDYSASGVPRIAVLEPAEDRERTPVPPEALPGSLDALSAMLLLSRQVRETGRCEGRAQIFDGRRLTRLDVVTDPVGLARGEPPNCVIESRLVAGIPVDQPEDAEPKRSVVHFGPPVAPDAPLLPVRIELASRWWGTIQVMLIQAARVGG